MCFADEKPTGKTSGVILIKTYNVESYKEYNKLENSGKSVDMKKNGKEVYSTAVIVETDDSGVFACSCILFWHNILLFESVSRDKRHCLLFYYLK